MSEEWFNPKVDLAEYDRLCEVVMKDGSRHQAYLSSARGWFKHDNTRLNSKFAMAKYRYIEDFPVKPWVRHAN